MIIAAKNITKYFYEPHKHKVLNDISLDIKAGELLSIFGESGSGKSTLLYILASLDIDYEGELSLRGKTLKSLTDNDLSSLRNKHIGFVYQSHHLLPEFNVLQNVMLPALRLNGKDIETAKKRALQLLNEIGLEAYA